MPETFYNQLLMEFMVETGSAQPAKLRSSTHRANLQVVRALDRLLPVVSSAELAAAVNFKHSSADAVHRWFRYREGFSPAILSTVSGAERLYDPFCGCGTVLLEAKRQSLEAVGTDVNPLAVFVARVKTADYALRDREALRSWLKPRLASRPVWQPPVTHLIQKLFQPAALHRLAQIRSVIETKAEGKLQDLLRLAWLSVLERCSNVFKEGNGIKYRKKRRHPGTYETVPDSIWIPRYFGSSIEAFVDSAWQRRIEMMIEDLEYGQVRRSRVTVIETSCLGEDAPRKVGLADAAIFSPPYANRFDYFEAFKMELWMGGFVSEPGDLSKLRQQAMRSNLTVADGSYSVTPELEELLNQMDETSSSVRMGIRNTLRGYFDDVRSLAANLRSVIRTGGRIVCVVGNSAYAGVLIPTDSLCAMLFAEAGFRIEKLAVARHLTVSPQQRSLLSLEIQPYMRESVLICRCP